MWRFRIHLAVLLLFAGFACAEQQAISVNYCRFDSGWQYHDQISWSSVPLHEAGFVNIEDPNAANDFLSVAVTPNWNDIFRASKGTIYSLRDHTGTYGPASLLAGNDFHWGSSPIGDNVDNAMPGADDATKNLGRITSRFVGHYPNGSIRTLATVNKVPYGEYMVIAYLNVNDGDNVFENELTIDGKTFYYLGETCGAFQNRLLDPATYPNPWLMAADTAGPASEIANIAIFRHLTSPDLVIDFKSNRNSGIAAFQIIAEQDSEDVAGNVAPETGAIAVPIATDLEWTAPAGFVPVSYDVYFGEYGDPNWALVPAATNLTDTIFTPAAPLDYNKSYIWRVDSHDSEGNVHAGNYWYFDAEGDPLIQVQPYSVAAGLGYDAKLSMTSILTDNYAWYRSADAATDTPDDDVLVQNGTSAELLIENVQAEDFAYYYCELTNTIPDSATVYTDVVELIEGKLEAYLTFENSDPNSVVNGWQVAPGNPDSTPGNTYEEGIIGDAIRFVRGTGDQLYIVDSEEYFNFYTKGFTINFWVKPDDYANTNGFMTYIAKNNGWQMFDTASYYGAGFEAKMFPLGTNTPAGRIDDGVWHMLTVTYNAGTKTMNVYQDGYPAGELVGDLNPVATAPVTFGNHYKTGTGGWGFNGLIDDVKIYNYPISAIDVINDYATVTGQTLCLEYVTEDINKDCRVDMNDLAIIAAEWLSSSR